MKKLNIFVIILLAIIMIISAKFIRNKVVIEKYKVTLKENLIFNMDIPNGTYKFASSCAFFLSGIDSNIENGIVSKDVFSKYAKTKEIKNSHLKYYGYAITKDGGEYIYTEIESEIDVLAYKIPLNKNDYNFVKEKLLDEDGVFSISILPFKDQKHLFIKREYNTARRITYAIINLENKTITNLSSYYSPKMNLRENVVILKENSGVLTTDYCVFDQNGKFIQKYR